MTTMNHRSSPSNTNGRPCKEHTASLLTGHKQLHPPLKKEQHWHSSSSFKHHGAPQHRGILPKVFVSCLISFLFVLLLVLPSSFEATVQNIPLLTNDDQKTALLRVPGPESPGFALRSHRDRAFAPLPSNRTRTVFVHSRKGFSTLTLVFSGQDWTPVADIDQAHVVYYAQSLPAKPILQPYQRYSRLPQTHEFRDKKELLEGLQAWAQDTKEDLWFLPETYRLSDEYLPQQSIGHNNKKQNKRRFLPHQKDFFQKRLHQQGGHNETWVLKNAGLDNGRGITFLPAGSQDLLHWEEAMNQKTTACRQDGSVHRLDRCAKFVVQKYVSHPLTWFRGEKFDLRFYWFVASIDPWIVFVHDGFARVSSLQNFDETDFGNSNLPAHLPLSNRSQSQKVTHEYVWQRVREFAKEQQEHTSPPRPLYHDQDPVEHVRKQIKHIMGSVVEAIRHRLKTRHRRDASDTKWLQGENNFAVFGVDLMIDQDLDVYLLETQHSPDIGRYDAFRVKTWNEIYAPVLGIVEEIQQKQQVDPRASLYPFQANLGGWELFYAGDWRYRYEGYKRKEKA